MKKHFFILLLIIFTSHAFTQTDSLTDLRDNKKYKTLKLGNTIWMAQNLNFRTDSGSICYDFNWDNCDKNGKLYNWKAAQVACPEGWRLPTNSEFENLLKLFETPDEGFKKLTAKGSSSMAIVLQGVCLYNENYMFFPSSAAFWSSTINQNDDYSPKRPFALELFSHSQFGTGVEINSNYLKGSFLYVRCVKK